MIGMVFLEFNEFICRAGISQRTTGFQVRQQYFFCGIENFSCFSHEMNTGKNNDIGICIKSFLR